MKCDECRYCILEDKGISNYTVEGTIINCLLNLNPGFPCDNFYGEREELKFAELCEKFSKGYHVFVDVNHDEGALENYSDDPEIKELLKKHKVS